MESRKKRKTDYSSPSTNGLSGRSWTVSIAIPSSILTKARSHDTKSAVLSQIARAAAVFTVDEIVLLDDCDHDEEILADEQRQARAVAEDSGYTAFKEPVQFANRILSYMETPPLLRSRLFPTHIDLRTADSLPPLALPHHLDYADWSSYREGVTIQSEDPRSTVVHTGLPNIVTVPVKIVPSTRLTLKLDAVEPPSSTDVVLSATPVALEEPRQQAGLYWGYTTRVADSLQSVFTEAPHPDGYDFCIGVSTAGNSMAEFITSEATRAKWKHLLICFGGDVGLNRLLEKDSELQANGVSEAFRLFDAWLSPVDRPGTRVLQAPEAVWLGLAGLQSFIRANHEP